MWDRSAPRSCQVAGCERPYCGRGYCLLHLRRVRVGGDPEYRTDQSGKNNPAWTETPTYYTVHGRLHSQQGRAADQLCACGEAAQHWAFLHTDPHPLVDESGLPYSADLSHYSAMCVPCHKKMDLARLERSAAPVAEK